MCICCTCFYQSIKKIKLIACMLFLIHANLTGQEFIVVPQLKIAPIMSRSSDLSEWKDALKISDFTMALPDDQGANIWPTTAYVAWGPDALYVAFKLDDPNPSGIRAFRHGRDDLRGDPDLVGVDVDPTGQGLSGMRYLVSPKGSQMDAILTEVNEEDYSYDSLWDSVGIVTETGYLVKMRIPYSNFRRGIGNWGLRLLRIVPRDRKYGVFWPKQSRDTQCSLCQLASISAPPNLIEAKPMLVIPVASATREVLRINGGSPLVRSRVREGINVRVSNESKMFEGTYRPDFSTVDLDVDPLEMNNRFRVFFPEKRPFFLEGMDMFGIAGAQRQFFSRSIRDPRYGIKISGTSSGGNWALLNSQDDEGGQVLEEMGATGAAGRSTLDSVAVGRMNLDDQGSWVAILGADKTLQAGVNSTWSRSLGVYFNKKFGNQWQLGASRIYSENKIFSNGVMTKSGDYATSLEFNWNVRKWQAYLNSQSTGLNFALGSGFVDLQGYRRINTGFGFRERWNDAWLTRMVVNVWGRTLKWWTGVPIEEAISLDGVIEFTGRLSLNINSDIAGRVWKINGTGSTALKDTVMAIRWNRYSELQPNISYEFGETLDHRNQIAARVTQKTGGFFGVHKFLSYNLNLKKYQLSSINGENTLIYAKQASFGISCEFPLDFYIRIQGYKTYAVVDKKDKDEYTKVVLGWHPNSFSDAVIGWSNQNKYNDFMDISRDRWEQRGFFVKIGYAHRF